jgi:simple sugar transport system ATP-binding protein
VRSLKEMNVTGIFISHNMHQVFSCCDRVVAMARGELVLDKRIEETSIEELHEVL